LKYINAEMVFGFFIFDLTPKVLSLKKGEEFKEKSENHFMKSIVI